jgi:hypothetical protein
MRIADGNNGQQADWRTGPGSREQLGGQGARNRFSGRLAGIPAVGNGECHAGRLAR